MAIHGDLKTIAKDHSVKEAVISFTVIPLIKTPESYERLLESGQPLSHRYQKFEKVKTVDIRINTNLSNPDTQVESSKITGFKMIGFRDGKVSQIIQGLNQPVSGVFTFNTVDYTHWTDFKKKALDDALLISEFQHEYNVHAFNLLYIDEFSFLKGKYNPNELFNPKSKNLPEGIFDAGLLDMNISMQRSKEHKVYQENLAIRVFNESSETKIRIVENLSFPIRPFLMTNLVKSNGLQELLDFAHLENKHLLGDVLNNEVADLIGLNK